MITTPKHRQWLRLIIGTLCAMPALAQQAATSEPVAADTTGEVEEIVVTAQRRSESLEHTPVAVAVVSGETLQNENITSERDLQFATPGLTVRASQSDNDLNYSLRGQTVDTYTSSLPSVLPYIDEVQVGGSASTVFYDLGSVQVLKGPQGTLFGRNATGGAVLFTTAKPTNDVNGYVSLGYGRFNDVQAEGAFNAPIVDNMLLMRIAGVYRSRDGIQENLYYDDKIGVINRQGARLSLTFNPSGRFTNEFVFDFYHAGGSGLSPVVSYVVPPSANRPGYPYVPDNVIFPGLVAFAAAQAARGPYVVDVDSVNKQQVNRSFVSNISSFEVSDNAKIRNIFGYVHDLFSESGDLDGTEYGIDGRGDAQTGPRGGDGLNTQYSDELQLVGKALDDRLDEVVGIYYSDENDQLKNTSYILSSLGLPPQINAGTTSSRSYAGYLQGTLDTGWKGFKVTGGFRYTSERIAFVRAPDDLYESATYAPFYADGRFASQQEDTFKKPSWTFGLQNQITESTLLYITSRRSFRSGGFNFNAPPTPGFANASGGEFRPEVATDVEAGAKFAGNIAGMPARVNLAAYNMWVQNIQRANYVAIYGGLAGITVNVPKAIISGFELDGSVKPTEHWTVGGNLNFTDARFTENQVPVLGTDGSVSFAAYNTYPDTPRWSGAAYSDYGIPVNTGFEVTLHGDYYYQSSNYYSSTGTTLNPGTLISSYGLANFRIAYEQPGKTGWSFAALVKNAFNKTYYTGGIGFASLFALNVVIPGEPRTYLVEARYKF